MMSLMRFYSVVFIVLDGLSDLHKKAVFRPLNICFLSIAFAIIALFKIKNFSLEWTKVCEQFIHDGYKWIFAL